MNWDTLQWIMGVALFVVFLVVMMRGCGGMMGGCGMGGSRMDQHRREERDAGDKMDMDRSKMKH